MSTPTQQWMRVCTLVVGSGGKGLDLSNLRIQFEVIKTVEAIPNSATIKVWNLTDHHSNQIQQEYSDVLLNAGYRSSFALIFAGNIQFVAHYKEQTDYITEITAGDGDRDYRLSYINVTLAAGATDADAVEKVRGAMGNIQTGQIQVQGTAYARGKVLSGHARDVLTQIARSNGCNWSIQDGKLEMVRTDAMVGEAFVLSGDTGLLEAPEMNDKGISAKCLLNPKLAINGAIKLDNNSIRLKQQQEKPLRKGRGIGQPQQNPLPRLDPDGIYKVIKLTHQGDTRSNEWYSLLECVGIGQPVPSSRKQVATGAVPVEGIEVPNVGSL